MNIPINEFISWLAAMGDFDQRTVAQFEGATLTIAAMDNDVSTLARPQEQWVADFNSWLDLMDALAALFTEMPDAD